MSKTNNKTKNGLPALFRPVAAAILSALIVLLTFTVGSLRVGPITVTFNCLPVAVGAVFLGPVYGAVLGAVFGLSSFFAAFGTGSLVTLLLSISPFKTFVMCLIPRILCGWIPGLVFKYFPKKNEALKITGSAISCVLTAILNTAFFMSFMWFLFAGDFTSNQELIDKVGGSTITSLFMLVFTMVTINAVMEWLLNLVLGTAVCKALFAAFYKDKKTDKPITAEE